jgi:hypothetical protein
MPAAKKPDPSKVKKQPELKGASAVDLFQQSNFSLVEFRRLNKEKQKMEKQEQKREKLSEMRKTNPAAESAAITPLASSVCSRPISEISTPRLSPLKLLKAPKDEGIVTSFDISTLESKIKAIEK